MSDLGKELGNKVGSGNAIQDLKDDVQRINAQIGELQAALRNATDDKAAPTAAGSGDQVGSPSNEEYVRALAQPMPVPGDKDEALHESTTGDLAQYVTGIRQATIATRGYGMLLEEMGLPKETKRAIKQIEEIAMAALKAANAIRLMQLAVEAGMGPEGMFYAAVSGGMMASSLAYGMKFGGSGV